MHPTRYVTRVVVLVVNVAGYAHPRPKLGFAPPLTLVLLRCHASTLLKNRFELRMGQEGLVARVSDPMHAPRCHLSRLGWRPCLLRNRSEATDWAAPLARVSGPLRPTQTGTLTNLRLGSFVQSGRSDSNRRRPAWEDAGRAVSGYSRRTHSPS